jgi:hypothetical protein
MFARVTLATLVKTAMFQLTSVQAIHACVVLVNLAPTIGYAYVQWDSPGLDVNYR